MGKDHYTAAREGTDEIGLAVAATTFSIIAVFVPIAFMPGVGGQWFKPFALTMACSVLVSLFVSFSLDPMLSAYWADPHVEEHEKAWITRAARQVQPLVQSSGTELQAGDRVGAGSPLAVVGARGGHVRRRARDAVIKIGGNALVGFGFFPEDDQAELNVTSRRRRARTSSTRASRPRRSRGMMRTHPEVRYDVHDDRRRPTGAVDIGEALRALVPKDERDHERRGDLGAQLRDELKTIGGAKIAVFATDWGGGHEADPAAAARQRHAMSWRSTPSAR